MFGRNILGRLTTAAADTYFFDAMQSYNAAMPLSQLGYSTAAGTVGAYFQANLLTNAIISVNADGTPGNTVVLRNGVNANNTTLVHELLHVVTRMNDVVLAQAMGWRAGDLVRDPVRGDLLLTPSQWISFQLNNECVNVIGNARQ